MLRALILALAFSLPIAAVANDNPPAVVIKDIPKFIKHQEALRADMENSKKFAHVDAASKRQLYAAQDQMFGVLKGKSSVEQLDADELVMVYNAQNEIAAILQNAEDDRPICERAEGVGSHFHTTTCTSKRQREANRGAARDMLEQKNKVNNSHGGSN
jgi:hypothetical protein